MGAVRLGFICDPSNNAYYRAIFPMRALERRGHTVVWPARLGEDVPFRELATCDLVHCYRSPHRLEDLRRLSARGVTVTFDNDDNYATALVSEGGSGLAGNRYNNKISREMLKMAATADLTTTPSEILAQAYRDAGIEHVKVIENYLERQMFGFATNSPHDGIVLGWVAASEHQADLDRLPILDALKRLLANHKSLHVLTVGLRLPLPPERYEHIPEIPHPQLLKIINRIDIGIAPLADIPFNHSRSNVKLKEYASGAATWLASPVGPYQTLNQRQGGQLVQDQDWLPAIENLIHNPRTRKRLTKKALKWAKQQTIDNHTQTWEQAFHNTHTRTPA